MRSRVNGIQQCVVSFSVFTDFMICYFLVPRNMKNLVLFLGSLVFYAWGEPVYIFLMLFSTIRISYGEG